MRQGKAMIVLTVLIGCAAFIALPAQKKPYPVATEVEENLKVVMNPDYPRDGTVTAKLVEELSLGDTGDNQGAILNKPLDLDVDGLGNLFIMDWGDTNIKVYDREGRFLRAIGRQGQGPGEFDAPAYFRLMPDGRVCLLDARTRRVSILDAQGAYLSGFLLDGFFTDIRVDGQGRLYLARRKEAEELKLTSEFKEIPYVTSIFRTDISGKEMQPLGDFRGESWVMKAAGGGVMSMGGIFTIAWNVSSQGRLCAGYNGQYRLSVFSPEGKQEFAFGRRFTPLKNRRYKGAVGQKKTMPAFTHFIVFDEEGNIWIEQYQDEDVKGFTYDVFSPEGIYLKQVGVEQRIFQFKKGKVYSIVRPEEGFSSVKRYRMESLK